MNQVRNKSILIVDDDARMLRALDKVLTSEGALVTSTAWAGDAIEVLTARQKPIDLVITDLRMPFVTGLTVVYAIHTVFPGLPVIVLTAFGSPEVRAECLRQGAAAFLEKPLDTAQLLEVVGHVFATHSTARNAVGTDPGRKNEPGNECKPGETSQSNKRNKRKA